MVALKCLVVGVGCTFTVPVSGDVAALREIVHKSIVKRCNQQFDPCALRLFVAKRDGEWLNSADATQLKQGEIPTFMTSIQTRRYRMHWTQSAARSTNCEPEIKSIWWTSSSSSPITLRRFCERYLSGARWRNIAVRRIPPVHFSTKRIVANCV